MDRVDEHSGLAESEVERLRAEIAGLRERLASTHSQFSHMANSKGNLLSSGRMCTISLTPDLTIAHVRNTHNILGAVGPGMPVEDAFKSRDVVSYFRGIRYLSDTLPRLARGQEDDSWRLVYPLETDPATGFTTWSSLPLESWRTTPATAQMNEGCRTEGYLMSPRELIGPGDDFRVEYTARSERSEPQDLSLVIGEGIDPAVLDVGASRPDRNGYCFTFGGMNNYATELQRSGEAIAANPEFRIVPGRSYRCLAQRLGGVLRFEVDGQECFSAVDCLPRMGAGLGYVGFYSCAPEQVFRDLKVWTRPTCLTSEVRAIMKVLERTVLHTPQAPAQFLEIHYLRNFLFLLKDVSEVVQQRERLEEQHREADKLGALLHLANAAAHEMNQPLTLLTGYLELILGRATGDRSAAIQDEELAALKEATDRMAAIVDKMGQIRRYKTKHYIGDSEILDIDASSIAGQSLPAPSDGTGRA